MDRIPASDRGKLRAPGTATLSRPRAAQSAEQGAGGSMAGVQARAIACYHAASPALARMLPDDIAVTHGTALP